MRHFRRKKTRWVMVEIDIPEDLLAEARRISKLEKISVNQLIVRAVVRFVRAWQKKNPKKYRYNRRKLRQRNA